MTSEDATNARSSGATESQPASHHLAKWDLWAILGLTAVAFVIRYFSPIMPDFFAHPFSGAPISNCVANTPVDAIGTAGTLCGLQYPFTRGSPDQSGQYQPPNGQVFDEVYFPVFGRNDIKGMESCKPKQVDCPFNYFDPEPPLAKLFIAAGEVTYGWYRSTFEGAHGHYVDLGFNTFGWRIAACIFGTLCVPMMYLLARRLWPNRLFAVAAAVLVCFDGMFFIQSRIGMIDIFPIFFILAAYYMYLVHIQSESQGGSLATLILLGTIIGVGIASKWIVLAAAASIVFLLLMRMVRRNVDVQFGPPDNPKWSWGRGTGPAIPGGAYWPTYLVVAICALVIIPIAIYIASWYPFFARGQFQNLAMLIDYQKQSFDYHAHLTATHPYGSPWWSWPLLSRPVAYYYESKGLGIDPGSQHNLVAGMVNLGNPWIWWTSLPCLLALPYFIIRERSLPATLILLGFITQWLPWSQITRVIFMYHMFGGLIFMLLALAFVLAKVADRWRMPGRPLLYAHVGLAVISFAYFYPVWTALPISDAAYFSGPDTPAWGPKMWLVHCDAPKDPSKPTLWCWI